MSPRLYELSAEFEQLQHRIDDGEDVAGELDALEGAVEEKAASIVHVLANLDASIDAYDGEIRRLQARKAAAVANKERLREYIRTCMQVAGVKRILSKTFVVSLQNSNDRVEVVDESLIPERFFRVKKEVSKSAILEVHQKFGECVPGTRIERGTKLVIR